MLEKLLEIIETRCQESYPKGEQVQLYNKLDNN